MSIFGKYASYYDLFYQGKDYAAEAAFVAGLIHRNAPGGTTVLELGCGTGVHAEHLVKDGFAVMGVDLSTEMVRRAQARALASRSRQSASIGFCHGDARTVRLDRKFDVVVSLFHVMSYQTTNSDVQAVMETAWHHLNPGGLFIFDCWYGPAVLCNPPEVRRRTVERDGAAIVRVATPTTHFNENVVDVRYDVDCRGPGDTGSEQIQETHSMRYFFKPELELFLEQCGFGLLESGEWMSSAKLSKDTWYAYFAAKKNEVAK